MTEKNWNRQARKSGGYRPARFDLPNLSAEELALLKQEADVRREFGEEGVRRFWEAVDRNTKEGRS